MTIVRAFCPDCGNVEVTIADVKVRVCDDTNAGTYAFRCPHCTMMVVKPAESRTIDLLIAAGVVITTWRLPAELNEPHAGPPIDEDYLIDFHTFLGLPDEAIFDALAANM